MIKLINVKKSFGGANVLDGVNLEIPEGKITTIIGLSGSGKSVILKHMIGLLKPDDGEIFLDGVEITKLGNRKLREARQNFSLLFQGAALLDSLTVIENVSLPLKELSKISKKDILNMAREKLEQVGLSEGDLGKYPAQLSGGMKKRVGLARALVTEPKTIFFDEPTTGLDPIMTKQIHNLIRKTHEELNITAVVVSHEIPKVFDISDYTGVLYEGRIVEFGSTDKIRRSTTHPTSMLIKNGG